MSYSCWDKTLLDAPSIWCSQIHCAVSELSAAGLRLVLRAGDACPRGSQIHAFCPASSFGHDPLSASAFVPHDLALCPGIQWTSLLCLRIDCYLRFKNMPEGEELFCTNTLDNASGLKEWIRDISMVMTYAVCLTATSHAPDLWQLTVSWVTTRTSSKHSRLILVELLLHGGVQT